MLKFGELCKKISGKGIYYVVEEKVLSDSFTQCQHHKGYTEVLKQKIQNKNLIVFGQYIFLTVKLLREPEAKMF